MSLQFHAIGSAEIPDGAINLHCYPGLVYAPQQHGEGIRFACNGRAVDELTHAQRGTIDDIDRMALAIGVSFADVCDGLKYLRDTGAI